MGVRDESCDPVRDGHWCPGVKRILFPHGLGDVVQAMPSLAAHAARVGPLEVGVLDRLAGAKELLAERPYIARVFGLADPWNDFTPANTWPGYHKGMRTLAHDHAPAKLIWTRPPADPLHPDVCKARRIATELGVPWTPTTTQLPAPDLSFALASPYAVVHGKSGNPIKDLPVYVLREIARQRLGFDPPIQPMPLVGPDGAPRPLRDQLAMLRGAALFVGVDSGPAHLASVLGVETLWVFTETPVQQALPWWRPNVRACVIGHRATELLASWHAWIRENERTVPRPLHEVESR